MRKKRELGAKRCKCIGLLMRQFHWDRDMAIKKLDEYERGHDFDCHYDFFLDGSRKFDVDSRGQLAWEWANNRSLQKRNVEEMLSSTSGISKGSEYISFLITAFCVGVLASWAISWGIYLLTGDVSRNKVGWVGGLSSLTTVAVLSKWKED